MSKRDHAELSHREPPEAASPLKKVKLNPIDAVGLFLDHSEELLQCIKALKNPSSAPCSTKADPGLRRRLAAVSKLLLPSIRALASEASEEGPAPGLKDAVQIPPHVSLTRWTAADIPKSMPPLLAVLDSFLETAALTHISTLEFCSEEDAVHRSYDRLEWLGDAYLELIATGFIMKTFPNLTSGRSTQIREVLIRNDTLAGFSVQYGLDKRAALPVEFYQQGSGAHKGKFREKVLGDLFEAYVGALIVSDPEDGVSRTAGWLKSIWATKIADKILKEEKRREALEGTSGIAQGGPTQGPTYCDQVVSKELPKAQLQRMLLAPGIKLRYEDLPPPPQKDKYNKLPLFSVGVFLDGWGEKNFQLGRGVALSKKEAGHKAAQMALDNKKLMKQYKAKRDAFLAARKDQAVDGLIQGGKSRNQTASEAADGPPATAT